MKLASLVNLKPLKEGAFGMAAKELAATYSLERLQSIRDEIMGDMEQEAEPEGGRIADMYADQLQGVDDAIAIKRGDSGTPLTYDQAVGRVSKDQFNKSSKFDRMNEATEKSWNAVDVSRKAEKEISNKEWNERTTKKLDMLKKLNDAGKFKKDWDEEKLQGWVDQNYSWEKLSRQFKLNESYLEMYSPEDMDNPDEDLVIIGSGYLDIKSNFGKRPSMTNGEYAELGQKVVDKLHNGDKEAAMDYIMSQINEGSCGYGPNGVPGDTPGETQGMDADDRTRGMLRMLIQKEIAKLKEGDPEAIKGKHYPDEDTVKKLKKGPYTPGGQNAQKEGNFDDRLKSMMGKDDFEKATSKDVPGLGDTVIDDKTNISTGRKTFMKMMMQFTDEPFLIETGLKLYDAWARGEGGLKPSRILKILQDTRN